MNIALVSDVHGNLPALQAVLAHARRMEANQVWNLGDFVGYGPFPDACVDLLRQHAQINLLGNYDQKALKVKAKKAEWVQTKIPEKWQAFEWAYQHLSKENRAYLRALPGIVSRSVEGWQIEMVHGSPASNKEHLTPFTSEDRLQEIMKQTQAVVILCGHSHVPFIRPVGDKLLINPGSVGRTDDGDPRASYALVRFNVKSVTVTHYRVPYEIEKIVSKLKEERLPEDFCKMFMMGRNLDFVRELNLERETLSTWRGSG